MTDNFDKNGEKNAVKDGAKNAENNAIIFKRTVQEIFSLGLSPTPVVYAVFYEFFAGENRCLSEEIEKIKRARPVIQDDIEGLFRTHIAPRLAMKSDEMTGRLVQNIVGVIDSTISTLDVSGKKLDHVVGKIETVKTTFEAQQREDLAALTGALAGMLKRAKETIDDSSKKFETTTKELESIKKTIAGSKEDSLVDPLTGLLNRRGLEIKILECHQEANAALWANPCSVLFLDLDHFKSLNDTHGHLTGDKVLRTVGEFLKKTLRGEDLAARFGGEEFVVVLPNTPLSYGNVVAEKIRKSIEKLSIKTKSGKDLGNITVSIGLDEYKFPQRVQGETGTVSLEAFWTTVHNADTALYHSKNSGRNRTTIYYS